MNKHRILTAISFVSVLVVIGLAGCFVHLFAAVPADAQSVTPTPLSLTPMSAPPSPSIPITASDVDRLALFTAMDLGFVGSFPGPIWSPDGRVVILPKNANTLNTLFPPGDPPLELELTPSEKEDEYSRVEALAFSSDGRLIVGRGSLFPNGVPTGFVQVWDSATGKVLDSVNEVGVFSMALSPDGKYLAADEGNYIHNYIRLWQVSQDGKLLPGPQSEELPCSVRYLAFSPDSLQLAAAVCNGTVLYSLVPWQQSVSLQGRVIEPSWLAFSDNLVIWNLKTGEQTDLTVPWEGDRGPSAGGLLSFNLDGSLLAAAFRDEVRLWDVSSGQTVALMKVEPLRPPPASQTIWVDTLAFSPDGTLLMAGASFVNAMWLWGIQ
jgi:WD40 repeat protein